MDSTYLIVLILAVVTIIPAHISYAIENAVNQEKNGSSLVVKKNAESVSSLQLKSTSSDVCLKRSKGRGIGTPLINKCYPNEEPYGALCYARCRSGYEAIGCCICRKIGCPSGFSDKGAICLKPASYGRGAGYPWKFGDSLNDKGMFKRCEAVHGAGNCEKSGAIVYPKCKSGFRAVGCCICQPYCQTDMVDLGNSCGKPTYGRGVGVSRLGCAANREQDASLCYSKCQTGYYGVGPICWQQCPSRTPNNCGVMCTENSAICAQVTLSIIAAAASAGIILTPTDFLIASLDISKTILEVMLYGYC